MSDHWWHRRIFGRSGDLVRPPANLNPTGEVPDTPFRSSNGHIHLVNGDIRPHPFNPLLNVEQIAELARNRLSGLGSVQPFNPLLNSRISISREDVDSWRDVREELRRMGLPHLVHNTPEDQEKIKEYIEFLKRDISEGFGINQDVLFGANTPNAPITLTSSARSSNSEAVDEFFNSLHDLSQAVVPLAEVLSEAVAPLVEAITPAMEAAIDNRLVGIQQICSRIESEHLRTIPRVYYRNIDPEHIIFFGGGRHENNDVRAQDDFLYTVSFGIMKLKEKGCDASLFNIFTNRRLLDIAKHDPHVYNLTDVNEFERISHRAEVNTWIIDDSLPDVIIIKPVPIEPPGNSRIPLMVAITGILNCGILDNPVVTNNISEGVSSELAQAYIDNVGNIPIREGAIHGHPVQNETIPTIYLNGVQASFTIAGGQHEDNNMIGYVDHIHTFISARTKLHSEGYEGDIIVISNQRIKDVGLHELERVRELECFSGWYVDDSLNNFIIFKNVPSSQDLPVGLVHTGILNFGRSNEVTGIANQQRTFQFGSAIIDGPRVDGSVFRGRPFTFLPSGAVEIGGTVGTIDLNEETPKMKLEREMNEAIAKLTIVKRDCWLCGDHINYRECCEANPKMIHKEVSALWNSKMAKIACCTCTDKLNQLVPQIDEISEIVIKKIYNQRYSVKEDFITNDKEKISDIKIKFGNDNNFLYINEKQLRNLLKYKILDIPIELEEVVEETEVEKDDTCRTEDREVNNEYYESP